MSLRTAAALCLGLLSTTVHALAPEAATEQVRARLVASVDAVYPGASIQLGVQQRIIPHWHTYWTNPGDSGLATTIAWTLPKGASVGEIQWPVPSRYTLGPVTNYGYADEVMLLSTLEVPTLVRPGESFPIKATVEWLVCREECIPQQVELALSLPVVANATAAGHGSALIGAAHAHLPSTLPWPASVERRDQEIALRIASHELQSADIDDIAFYPTQWGRIVHGAAQPRHADGSDVLIELQPGEAPLKPDQALDGLLVVTERTADGTVRRGFSVSAGAASIASEAQPGLGLVTALLLALLGGLILNAMPCVFPVLSIKALSLLQHAHQSPLRTRLQGLAYTLGVLASFALLGILLIALKGSGAEIGWGFQFQSPLFVLTVAYLMFAVGLSLSGVFSLGAGATGLGSSLATRSGYAGSFFTGALATVVATPCTAPFMGAALGYAVTQPPAVLLVIFLSLGLGLALPYLALSTWPALQRLLPRPGAWMDRLKQFLAFPMYGTAAWLVWVLTQQAGSSAVAIALGGMIVIAFAAWLYDTTRLGGRLARHGGTGVASLALVLALAGSFAALEARPANATAAGDEAAARFWEPYSPQRLAELRAVGKPVFVNLTAAWCITCLANERIALGDNAVVDAFKRAGITYLKGDWTNRDPQITAMLASFGRGGVPLYVSFPSGTDASPRVLPQLLTPEIVLDAIGASGNTRSLANR